MRLLQLRLLLRLGLDLERFLAGRYTSVGDDLDVVSGLSVRHPYKLVCLSVIGFIQGGCEVGRVGGDREGQAVLVLFTKIIEFPLLLLLGGKELASRLFELFRSLMGEIPCEVRRYFFERSSVRLGDSSHLFLIRGENPITLLLDGLEGEAFEFLVV